MSSTVSQTQTAASESPESPEFVTIFKKVVAAAGSATAAVAHGASVTYQQLDALSDDLAARLTEQLGPGPDPVVIMCGHDIHAVIAFIAVAKSGRPAVCLDTTTPVARMRQISELAGPAGALVDKPYLAVASEIGPILGRVLPIEESRTLSAEGTSTALDPDRVLSVVFTSGSTGTPKGVMLGNREFCESIVGINVLDSGSSERIGVPQPLSFIGGSGMMLRAIMTGAEAHLYDPRREGIEGMVDWIEENQLTSLSLTPYAMRSLAEAAIARGVTFSSLVSVTVGGEAVLVSDVAAMRRCTTERCVIVNASGSSEGWGVSYLVIDRNYELPASGQVPAGHGFEDRELFIEDESGDRIVEPGTTGMIMIAAMTMASGYWRNPELTAERFSTRPDGTRVYRTGDLGRWNDKGELEYAGRADHMVKVRGYLVEPAEVESCLLADGEVREAVVVGAPGREGAMRLVAYVVPDPGSWVSVSALRRRLLAQLPSYMLPSAFVELMALPRNPNGKVDRLALPAPSAPEAPASRARWNSVTLAIAAVSASALGVEDLSLSDDLLDLGADSLTMVEILTGLEEECGIVLSSADFLESPTVEAIAARPRRPAPLSSGVLVPLRQSGEAPPLFCVAGAAGLAMVFRSLVRHLPEDYPVYGLQAFGIEGRGLADRSVRATARRYVRAIRTVQPTGPYRVIGHSLGGIIAFEVAQLLERDGETVSYLGFLDVFPALDGLSADGLARFLPGAEALHSSGAEAGARFREQLFMHYPYLLRRYWVGRNANRFALYATLGVNMVKSYRPPPRALQAPAAIFWAAENATRSTSWEGRLAAAPAVHVVPGDHLSMLRVPFVRGLAEALGADLAQKP